MDTRLSPSSICILASLLIMSAAAELRYQRHLIDNELLSLKAYISANDSTKGDVGADSSSQHRGRSTMIMAPLKTNRRSTLRVVNTRRRQRRPDHLPALYGKRHAVFQTSPMSSSETADSNAPISRSRRHGMAVLKSSKTPIVITRASHLRKDWCSTEHLRQRIKEKGCRPRTIQNRFCYGQCNSFYIPQENFEVQNTTAFQSCAFCKPFVSRWITIPLQCPGLVPPVRKTRVLRIVKCRCMSEVLR